jgi:hypothetical protein
MRKCPNCKRQLFAEKKRYCHYCGAEVTPVQTIKVAAGERRSEPPQSPGKKRSPAVIAGSALGVVLIVTVIVSLTQGNDSPATTPASGTDITTGYYPTPTPTTTRYTPPTTYQPSETEDPSDPATVVTNYYAAVDRHDYQTAWDLGGANFGKSYTTFVKGYETTASETLTVLNTSGNTVNIDLAAVQSNGAIRYYEGSYTVSDGKITHGTLRLTSSG